MIGRMVTGWGSKALLPTILVGVLAACGGPAATGSPAGTRQSSPAVSPTASSDPRDAAIVAAYTSSNQAFVAASQAANPNDPLLAQTMTGEELFTVVRNLNANTALHIVGRGDVATGRPHVTSLDGSTATVRDCVWDTLRLFDARTGAPIQGVVNGQGGEYEGVTATLIYAAGSWRVSAEDIKAGTCPPGY